MPGQRTLEGDERLQAMARAIMSRVGNMIGARFEALEGRLLPARPLRPPLGVGGKAAPVEAKEPEPAGAGWRPLSRPSRSLPLRKGEGRKGGGAERSQRGCSSAVGGSSTTDGHKRLVDRGGPQEQKG